MAIARYASGVPLALFMVFMGVQKFTGSNPIFTYIADQSGMAFFEPQVRMIVGAAELACAAVICLGFFVKPLKSLGALMALAIIGGALAFHLSPWLGINAPTVMENGEPAGYSPMLFVTAIVFFVVALAHLILGRNRAGGSAAQPGA